MLLGVSTPPSDPIANELQSLRASLEMLSQRVGELAEDNKLLREQLAQSQTARTDLVAQTEHLLHQLAQAQSKG
ncbi:MAG: chromosome segregation ATPase [Planctomycetota bacterium]|jgi:chromosome segregation ATPase